MEAIAIRLKAIATSNKKLLVAPGITTSNKGITSSNKKLLGTSASPVVTSALLVVTRS